MSLPPSPGRAAPRARSTSSLTVQVAAALVLVAALAVAGATLASNQVVEGRLSDQIGATLHTEAQLQAAQLAATLLHPLDTLRALSLTAELRAELAAANAAYGPAPAAQLAERERQWAAAADDAPLVQARLAGPTAAQLRIYTLVFPDLRDLLIADRYGAVVAATARPARLDQSAEAWWRAAWGDGRGGRYLGLAEAPAGAQATLTLALPVRDAGGAPIGVLRATYALGRVAAEAAAVRFGASGGVQLLIDGRQLVAGDGRLVALAPADVAAAAGVPAGRYRQLTYQGRYRFLALAPLELEGAAARWHVLIYQDEDEVLEIIGQATQAVLQASLGVLLAAALAAWLLAHLISRPIRAISATAEQIAGGDLSRRLTISRGDAIGALARSFNAMAEALAERIAAEQAAQSDRLQQQQQLIQLQYERLRELEAPVIPLGRGALLAPLLGVIDAARVAQLAESLPAQAAAQRASLVLLDLTGVPQIEPGAAAGLIRTAEALRLIGARVALVGVRAAVAPALAAAGLSEGPLSTYTTLEAALEALYPTAI